MRKPLLILWIFFHIPFLAAGSEETNPIDRFAEQLNKRFGFSGIILIAQDGKTLDEQFIGEASPGVPVDRETLFEIASLTKPVTATAVMILHERKKLDLDDSVRILLPEIPEDCDGITIRHLLQHTSGIPGTNTDGSGENFPEVAVSFFAGGPQADPGTRYEYWNQGYAVLSETITRASGVPYTTFIKEEIFAPCGMKQSCFTGDPIPESAKVALGKSGRGNDRTALSHPYGSYGYQYRGMGGIVTTARDFSRFLLALESGSLLSPESLEEMWTPKMKGYALGWRVLQDEHRRTIGHGGRVRGFLSSVVMFPEVDGHVLVFSNNDDPARGFYHARKAGRALLYGEAISLQSLSSVKSRSSSSYLFQNPARAEIDEDSADQSLSIRGVTGFLMKNDPQIRRSGVPSPEGEDRNASFDFGIEYDFTTEKPDRAFGKTRQRGATFLSPP